MVAVFMKFLVAVAVAYFGLIVFVYAMQRQMMYLPSADRMAPEIVGLDAVDEVTLTTPSNLKLYSWYGPARAGQPTVLLFHGNAGAVVHREYRFRQMMRFGWGVFVLGYPGYGGSDGRPSEPAFHEAAMTAYEFLIGQGIAARDIVLYGESIGAAVAVRLAAGVDARALILESPMASAVDVASRHYPYLPVRLLLKDAYLSVQHIGRIAMPLLIMHGEADRIIPLQSGEKLFARAVEPKRFVALSGAGHNDLFQHPTAEIARQFLVDMAVGEDSATVDSELP